MSSPNTQPPEPTESGQTCLYCKPGTCPVAYGLCHCGCGSPAPIAPANRGAPGATPFARKGKPQKFVRTHQLRPYWARDDHPPPSECPWCQPGQCPVGLGMCHCGCGRTTSVSRKNNRSMGRIIYRGWAYPFCMGHHAPGQSRRKLDYTKAQEIRRRVLTGERQTDLAEEFNVSNSLISQICLYDKYTQPDGDDTVEGVRDPDQGAIQRGTATATRGVE